MAAFGDTIFRIALVARALGALDERDMALLCELWVGSSSYFRSDSVSLEAAGRVVGVHGTTIKARLAKWRALGFLHGFTLDVDPAAYGGVGRQVQFSVAAPDKERALRAASLVDGVQHVLVFRDGWVGIPFYASSRPAAERTQRLLSTILEAHEVVKVSDTSEDYPDVKTIGMSGLDVDIVKVLLEDARRSPSQVATATDASVRTIERRSARLRSMEIISTLPRVDWARSGRIAAAFVVTTLDGAAAKSRALRVAPRQFTRNTQAEGVLRLGMWAPTLAKLEKDIERLRAVPGVRDVRARVFERTIQAPGFNAWLGERLDQRAPRS